MLPTHAQQIDWLIHEALREDIADGDHTTLATIPHTAIGRARCLVKDGGVLAGMGFARRVFELVEPEAKFDQLLDDGARIQPGDVAFTIDARVHTLLTAERLVLNVMQRMSGIATQTRQAADLIADTRCKLLDTRKTTPLNRVLEKWAVRIGGGHNHRWGLYDMILIKDNHIDHAGGVAQALSAAKRYVLQRQLDLKIEIETRNLAEVQAVLQEGGAHRILLDNMDLETLRQAVALIGTLAETEASGGINLTTLRPVALTGVGHVSMGALTHHIRSLDISLKAVK